MKSKFVIFIRHAKSSWMDLSIRDFDRPLDNRGNKDAPAMARRLEDAGFIPDAIISSAAKRAMETANYFSKHYGNLPIEADLSLYHAPPFAYMEKINHLSEDTQTVILVGHNPGMTEIANLVQSGLSDDISTCGIIITECKRNKEWNEIDWDDLSLIALLEPK
jgi:phosphohistidine phosphatase